MAAYFEPKKRLAVEETLQTQPSTPEQRSRRRRMMAEEKESASPESRHSSTSDEEGIGTMGETIVEAASKYFAPHTMGLASPIYHRHSVARRLVGKRDNSARIPNDGDDLKRFSFVQVKLFG